MMDEYLVWQHSIVPNACVLDQLMGLEEQYRLRDGIKLAKEFPNDVYFTMDPDLPHDTLLVDSLYNINDALVFSEPLMTFLSELNLKNLEFLPIKIMNHKGKFVDERYFIFNVLDHQDCLNIEESGARLPRLKTGVIRKIKKLVLHNEKFDHDLDIFRIKGLPSATLVKKNLVAKIDAMGFTAIDWISMDEFNGRLY